LTGAGAVTGGASSYALQGIGAVFVWRRVFAEEVELVPSFPALLVQVPTRWRDRLVDRREAAQARSRQAGRRVFRTRASRLMRRSALQRALAELTKCSVAIFRFGSRPVRVLLSRCVDLVF